MRRETKRSTGEERREVLGEPTRLPAALAALPRLALAQRAAILARDAAALSRCCDALAQALIDLAGEPGSSGHVRAGWNPADVAALARQARDHIRINQALIENGMAIADHYVAAAAEAAASCNLELFSGVA